MIRGIIQGLGEGFLESHNNKITAPGKCETPQTLVCWEMFPGSWDVCRAGCQKTVCARDHAASPPRMRRARGCARMWGFCPLTDRQRVRERVMDLTQIRVDYTHPPCLQSALHNLKSSYASLSHFWGWGEGVCVCVSKIQGDSGSHILICLPVNMKRQIHTHAHALGVFLSHAARE